MFTYYALYISSELSSYLGVSRNHFSWINSAIVVIVLTIINVLFRNVSERYLLKCSGVLTTIALLFCISLYSMQFIYSYNMQYSKDVDGATFFLVVYAIIVTIVASASIAF